MTGQGAFDWRREIVSARLGGEAGFQTSLAKFMKQAGFSSRSSHVPVSRRLLGGSMVTMMPQWNILPKVLERNPTQLSSGYKVRVSSLLLLQEQFTEEL